MTTQAPPAHTAMEVHTVNTDKSTASEADGAIDRRSALARMLAGSSLVAASATGFADTSSPALRDTAPALVLTVPTGMQPNAFWTMAAAVRRPDGSLVGVQPQWRSSNPIAASVSRIGVLASGPVLVDTAVQITATVFDNGVALTASQNVFIYAASARLSSVAVEGSRSLQSGSQLRLQVMAHYDDLSYRRVKPTSWSLHSDNSEAITFILSGGLSVDFTRGVLKLNTIDRQYALDISAVYTEGIITATGRLDLVATNQASTLTSLTIVSTGGVAQSGDLVRLKALGSYADQSLKTVQPTWQVDHSAVQISSDGQLTVGTLNQDTALLVTASYTEAGITTVAEFQMQLQTTRSALPFALEVEATGPRSRYRLAGWVQPPPVLAAAAQAAAQRGAGAVKGYNLYVVAVVPAAQDTTALPALYVLNRSKEWQVVGSPLAEYLSAVSDSQSYLIDIFEQADTRLITGTAIYVGFGTSDTEMLSARRYRVLQVL